jgi:two-component system, NarL family, sensor histidine kinase UhpB
MKSGKELHALQIATGLRSRAEAKLLAKQAGHPPPPRSRDELQRLVHELEVHQIELEMQNEALLHARNELDLTLDKYSELFDSGPVGYLTLGRDAVVTAVSLSTAGLLGVPRSRLLGRRFDHHLAPESRPAFTALLAKVFAFPGKAVSELALQKEGASHLFVRIEAVAASSGGECCLALIDLTERRRMEEELAQSERRYRAVVEGQTELITRYLPDGSYSFVNQAYCRFFGRSSGEVIGSPWQPDAVAADLPMIERQLRQLSPGNPVAVVENRVISGNGEERWMQFINRGFFDAEGRLIETQAVGRDITERKRAEITLAESKAQLNSVLESTSDLIWSVEPVAFGLSSFNGSFSEFLFARHGVRVCCGMLPGEIFPIVEYVDRWIAFYRRTLEQGPFTLEYEIYAGDEVFELTFNPLRRDGTVFGVSVFGKEITARKKAEETLKRYARRLIVLEEELRKRIAMELHDDVGQELTALGLNLAYLGKCLPAEIRDTFTPVLEDSRLLTREISRSVRNLMVELRPPQLDEYGLASALRSYAEQYAQRTNIAVSVEVDPGFPRLPGKVEPALFRITQEALNNVAKYAEATKVLISLSKSGALTRLLIRDDGRGFVPQGASLQPMGSGWGLTIMRERAELAGGRFRLETGCGAGTSVIVEIPG